MFFVFKKSHSSKPYSVPGWNNIVSDKHLPGIFLEWCNSGKPKTDSLFRDMLRTRAEFKATLRYSEKYEEQIKADKCEFSLDLGNAKAFWKTVYNAAVRNVASNVLSIGDVSGAKNIADLWKLHFEGIYYSISDSATKA